jgi:hypothetical protein
LHLPSVCKFVLLFGNNVHTVYIIYTIIFVPGSCQGSLNSPISKRKILMDRVKKIFDYWHLTVISVYLPHISWVDWAYLWCCLEIRLPSTMLTIEIIMPDEMQHFPSYISLQWGFIHRQNSTAALRILSAFFTRNLCAVSQGITRLLCRAALQMGFSVVDKSRKKLVQSKQILLLSAWQKQLFILNDTF